MRHEPCAAIRELQHPMKLMRGHSLLAGAEQMIGKQPLAQRNMAVLEDRAQCDGELLTASATLPYAFADVLAFLGRLRLKAVGIVEFATMWADRARWPA